MGSDYHQVPDTIMSHYIRNDLTPSIKPNGSYVSGQTGIRINIPPSNNQA